MPVPQAFLGPSKAPPPRGPASASERVAAEVSNVYGWIIALGLAKA